MLGGVGIARQGADAGKGILRRKSAPEANSGKDMAAMRGPLPNEVAIRTPRTKWCSARQRLASGPIIDYNAAIHRITGNDEPLLKER